MHKYLQLFIFNVLILKSAAQRTAFLNDPCSGQGVVCREGLVCAQGFCSEFQASQIFTQTIVPSSSTFQRTVFLNDGCNEQGVVCRDGLVCTQGFCREPQTSRGTVTSTLGSSVKAGPSTLNSSSTEVSSTISSSRLTPTPSPTASRQPSPTIIRPKKGDPCSISNATLCGDALACIVSSDGKGVCMPKPTKVDGVSTAAAPEPLQMWRMIEILAIVAGFAV